MGRWNWEINSAGVVRRRQIAESGGGGTGEGKNDSREGNNIPNKNYV